MFDVSTIGSYAISIMALSVPGINPIIDPAQEITIQVVAAGCDDSSKSIRAT